MRRDTKRLTILSPVEQDELYGFPTFNDEERAFYFALDDAEKKEMASLRSIESRVHFIVQLGYFKAKFIFFDTSFSDSKADVTYIMNHHFSGFDLRHDNVSKRVRFDNYTRILTMFSYAFMRPEQKEQLDAHARESARLYVDPLVLFECLLAFLAEHRIVLPGYSTLQDCVTQALQTEMQRLHALIDEHMSPFVDETIKKLMTHGEDDKMYGITVLKKDAKGFNHKEMMKEIEKKNASELLFKSAKQIIPMLDLSEQNIGYYASLVDYYSVDRLKELSYDTVRLYVLCYITYRFEKIHDNLISIFFYRMGIYHKKAKDYAKNAVYDHKIETSGYGKIAADILDLLPDDTIHDPHIRPKAFQLFAKEDFSRLTDYLRHQSFDEAQFKWAYYLTIGKTIAKNLRPLVRAIDFDCDDRNDPLMHALTFIKETFANKQSLKQQPFSAFPIDFVPASLQGYLYEERESDGVVQTVFNAYQYEFLVYHQLANALDTGHFFVNTSLNFKSLNEDLYPDWDVNKEEVLKQLNNPVLNTPIKEQLKTLKDDYNPLMLTVNHRIEKGENKSIHIKKQTTVLKDGQEKKITEWTLPYKKQKDEIDNPFYDQLPQVSLIQVLHFVYAKCPGLLDQFVHIKSRYAKTKADIDALFATITALATGYGIAYMADISDMRYTHLLATFKNFIRLENLKEVNALLVNEIATLPMFKRWHVLDNQLLASIDGRKMLIRHPHAMARFSSKYFGQKRGVVSVSMIANNACPNQKLISPNDYEGHHLFDVSYNNMTHVQPNALCGDTHSINRLNFALMHVLGCRFVPHIKNIREHMNALGSFEEPSLYEGSFIVPKNQFNEALIEEEWDNIQHIYASLLMKRTTQSAVVRKLSSYTRPGKTKRALWEYNRILQDRHALHFIDSPSLRQSIRTSLNRGEGYHQLENKIMSINGSKLRGSTELELAISNECIRFIASCIIFYNTYILSELYDMHEKLGNTEVLAFITRLSPIAWRHINLNGRYEFTTLVEALDLQAILANLVFDDKKSYTKK